ncbi:MAG: hypothetical protein ACFE9S_20470 [Candidatus Hermodarchaeota archaeon]
MLLINLTQIILFSTRNNNQESFVIQETNDPILSSVESWTPDGEQICTAIGSQSNVRVCNDGVGGAVIVWQDYRSGSNYDIYAQSVYPNGSIRWAYDGTEICTAPGSQQNLQICSDGVGGAIIVWQDYRSGSNYDIYAQSIYPNGSIRWAYDGTEICTVPGSQQNLQICSNGVGGAIITWEDYRSESNYDIYAQLINISGNIVWTPNGTEICSAIRAQKKPQICSNMLGGAIIAWEDYRTGSNYDIYAQQINSSGNIIWTPNGTEVCLENKDQMTLQLCEDGSGGAIIAWEDHRDYYDIYAQRVDFNGNKLWDSEAIAICTAYNCQQELQICSDKQGGAIIVWEDHREVYDISVINYDIYAQRVDSIGNLKWKNDGKGICTASEVQDVPQICSDGIGGAFITWMDRRFGSGTTGWQIYAQNIGFTGKLKWKEDGIGICTLSTHMYPQICSDGVKGAIIVWEDLRGVSRDIYAQLLVNIDESIIPFGNFYLIFVILVVMLLFIYIKHKSILKSELLN